MSNESWGGGIWTNSLRFLEQTWLIIVTCAQYQKFPNWPAYHAYFQLLTIIWLPPAPLYAKYNTTAHVSSSALSPLENIPQKWYIVFTVFSVISRPMTPWTKYLRSPSCCCSQALIGFIATFALWGSGAVIKIWGQEIYLGSSGHKLCDNHVDMSWLYNPSDS